MSGFLATPANNHSFRPYHQQIPAGPIQAAVKTKVWTVENDIGRRCRVVCAFSDILNVLQIANY